MGVGDTVQDALNEQDNNYPYTPITGLDPTVGVSDAVTDLNMRCNGLYFESISKNLASLNYRETYPEPKVFLRVYYITPDKTITVKTDMRTRNKIVKEISGAIGTTRTLTKTLITIPGIVTDCVYS